MGALLEHDRLLPRGLLVQSFKVLFQQREAPRRGKLTMFEKIGLDGSERRVVYLQKPR
jgi:hypothetical protein